ncbi:MAG: biotin/lipoyl-containing protein [bacterium]
MHEFVANVNSNKYEIKIDECNNVLYNGKQYDTAISKVSNYSYLLKIGEKVFDITTHKLSNEEFRLSIDGYQFDVTIRSQLEEMASEFLKNKEKLIHHDMVRAPMPGLVLKIKKKEGEKIEIGESVVILEAMKMENEIRSPASGVIKEMHVKEGCSVEKDEIIFTIE